MPVGSGSEHDDDTANVPSVARVLANIRAESARLAGCKGFAVARDRDWA
jgi:hypothetical protein